MSLFYDIVEKVTNKHPLDNIRLCKLFFTINDEDKKSLHKKFGILSKYLLLAIGLTMIDKDNILTVFQKSQKVYRGFCAFAFNYKIKKYPINVDHDIYYNKLEKYDKNVINIFQNKKNYLFKTSDLVNIIENALCNSYNFFLEPKFPVNPYNKIPFSLADLYNLYFKMKNMDCVIPKLFNSFFLSDFDIDLFFMDNEMDIKERIIYKFIYNNNDLHGLNMEFRDMMREFYRKKTCHKSCNRCRKINRIIIDDDFPKKKLIDIMKPYLYLFCSIKYSLAGLEKIDNYKLILNKKLKEFIKFNPMFGRKYIKYVNNKPDVHFDDKHETFTLNDIRRWGQTKERINTSVVIPIIMSFRQQEQTQPEQREYIQYDNVSDTDSNSGYESSDSETSDFEMEEVGTINDYDNEEEYDSERVANNTSTVVPNYPTMPPAEILSIPLPRPPQNVMYIRRPVGENSEIIIEVPIGGNQNNREIEDGEIVE